MGKRRHTVRGQKDSQVQYLVKWLGYGDDENTWESLSDLAGAKKKIKQFERERSSGKAQKKKPAAAKAEPARASPAAVPAGIAAGVGWRPNFLAAVDLTADDVEDVAAVAEQRQEEGEARQQRKAKRKRKRKAKAAVAAAAASETLVTPEEAEDDAKAAAWAEEQVAAISAFSCCLFAV